MAAADTRPFSGFEWMISLRYLRARRREGFISVIAGFSFLGIMLGVATLIIVMSVMNGFRSELLGKILGLNGHMVVRGIDTPFSDYDVVAERLAALEGIQSVVPSVEGPAMASSPLNATGALVRGVRADDLAKLKAVAGHLRNGTLEGFDSGEGVILGSRLAESLGLIVGENVTLIAPRGAATPFGTAPRVKSYKLLATVEIGMSEYDSTFVFMPLEEAQLFFNKGNTVTALEILVADPDDMDAYRRAVEAAAGRSVFVVDWRQRNRTFFSALEVERNVMFLILTLIVLVAALNIVSGLIMLVKDKGPDIGILRTMGATQGAVMRIFFITGASIGVVGTSAGFGLGLLVCLNIETLRQFLSGLTGTELFSPELYYLSQLPAELDPSEVAMVVAMSLILSFLATLYPAWRAARLDPVEALRDE